ncbi:MAG: glycosyltransferase [Cyanophyceae cyanobacterium]
MSLSPDQKLGSPIYRGYWDLPLTLRWKLFFTFAIANGIWGAYYIAWRIGYSLNYSALWISIPLLLVECYSYFGALMFMGALRKPKVRDTISLEFLEPPLDEWPTVDVFITHYNEGRAVVEPTVRGSLAINYPKEKLHIYILDDGKDADIENLAAEYQVGYITRPTNLHFKAGNINHALINGNTSGDFIVTLDCDHIPKPEFLQRTLLYFYERSGSDWQPNRIAFVQTPQYFSNIPERDPFGHRASLFYGPIQQGKDGLGSAFYTGTNAILRREAIMQVAMKRLSQAVKAKGMDSALSNFEYETGLSTTSITEDMQTALNLHAQGWESAYHNEILALGLAPEDLQSTLKQRLRWAQGTLQVMLRDNPLTKQGLTIWQRLAYFQTMYSYFSGFAVLVYLLCPIIYFVSGIAPVAAFSLNLGIRLIPFLILNRLAFLASGWGISWQELWRSEQFAVALFPLQIQAVWSVLTGQKIRFEVTSKQRNSGVYLNLIKPQLIIMAITLITAVYAAIRLAIGNSPLTIGGFAVNLFWSAYNLLLLSAAVRAAIWQDSATTNPAS